MRKPHRYEFMSNYMDTFFIRDPHVFMRNGHYARNVPLG